MNVHHIAGSVAVALIASVGCSSGDGPSLGSPVDPAGSDPVASPDQSRGPDDGADASSDPGGDATADGGDELAAPADPEPSPAPTETVPTEPETPGAGSAVPAETAPIETVPETGVAGLDADDGFCAAWARFGGTWQVLIVGSQFLDDPDQVARWEVAAAPVVDGAYQDLIDDFPAQAAAESDLAVDGYFGALARRSAVAGDALRDAGATDDQLARLADAWLAALRTRSSDSPAVELELEADLAPLVAEAAVAFREQRVPIHTDPSMIVTVQTPATDAFIADSCPDQGTLSGVEVDP